MGVCIVISSDTRVGWQSRDKKPKITEMGRGGMASWYAIPVPPRQGVDHCRKSVMGHLLSVADSF